MTPYVLLAVAIPLGLALLPPGRRLMTGGLPGLGFSCGWAAAILVLFLAGAAGVPLRLAAWALCAAAAAGYAHAVLTQKPGVAALIHPLVILTVGAAAVLLAAGPVEYRIYAWDSWTNWVGWARQMVTADAVYTPEMWIATRGDMPGWPLAMALPGFVTGTFVTEDAWAVAISLHIGLVAALFDVVRTLFRRLSQVGEAFCSLSAWAIVLAALAGELTWTLLPQLLLIEEPQYFLLAGGFLAVAAGLATGRRGEAAIAATLLMAAAFAFKTSFVAFAPAFLLTIAYLLFRTDAGWCFAPAHFAKLAAAGLALAAVGIVWGTVAPEGRCQSDTLGIVARLASDEPVHGIPFATFAANVLERMSGFAVSWKLPITLAALLGMLAFVRHQLFLVVLLAVTGTWVVFYAGVVSGMASCFSATEISEMASVQRYSRVPLRLMQTLGFVMLVAALAWGLGRIPGVTRSRLALLAVVAGVVLLGTFQLHRSAQVVRLVAERGNVEAAIKMRADAAARDVAVMIAETAAGSREILYFAPRPDVERIAANFHGLGRARGQPLRRVAAQHADIAPTGAVQPAITRIVARADVIVVVPRQTPRLSGYPAVAAALEGCTPGEAGYFLFASAPGQFACRARPAK
jgi:hypothetical protein